MLSRKPGYEAIPQHDEDEGRSESRSLSSPASGSSPSTWTALQRAIKNYKVLILPSLLGISLVSLVLAASLLLPDVGLSRSSNLTRLYPIQPGISTAALQDGLSQCQKIQEPRLKQVDPSGERINPRGKESKPVLLQNAVVWNGQGNVLSNVDILLENGIVAAVGRDITPGIAKVINVGGRIVSPGLVDMHSHLGVDSWPFFSGTDDTNEMTTPLTPFVRSLDAFNPSDKAIRIVASGGVTTALVLPGSGNLMGGEAYAFKLRPVPTVSNDDMLVQAGVNRQEELTWRWMKMACGENPKVVYGSQGRMPSTRLGEAYLFRQRLADAQRLMHEQDDWCSAAEHLDKDSRLTSRFPEDLSLESLVALLRGDVRLNIHCYETHDIEAMVRHSLEFNFTISAFHHALDAYRIPDILKRARNNITVATFADHWGYKKEAFQATPRAPRILLDAGIPVALKSDHPVINSQHLVFEAAKANHYGLSRQEAFKTVTSVPANALGLGHRIGSLKVGYDADVVIWDRDPLEMGAAPLQVFVDGIPLFDETPITPLEMQYSQPHEQPPFHADFVHSLAHTSGHKDFVLTNARVMLHGHNMEGQVVVRDGKIVCAAVDCAHAASLLEIDLKGSYVIPGIVAVGSALGLVEIPTEGSTGDGVVKAAPPSSAKEIVEAVDGIKLGTRHLEEAFKGGVMTAITAPMSNSVVVGVSAAFRTSADSVLANGAMIASHVALHLQVGDDAKSDSFPTVSSQIAFLRRTFDENRKENNYYGQVARGEIPVIVAVNNKDEIASLIRLKRLFQSMRLTIQGGAEAHLLASRLAEADIAVILQPSLCTPEKFDSIHCLTGAPLTNGTAAHVLHRHGVKIGLGVPDDGLARNLAWDAGWLSSTSNAFVGAISEAEAVQFITTNLQDIFGLDRQGQMEDDFVVWSGSPFQLHSRPVLTHSSQHGIQLAPLQG